MSNYILHKKGIFEHHLEDGEEHPKVIYARGVGAGVIWHEKVEEY